MRLLTFLVFLLLVLETYSQSTAVPYTLEDRDRMIRLEEKFESQQKQLDDIKSLFYWGFGIMISLSLFTMGYMVWDRRTALRPVQDESRTLSEKYENLIRALKN
ncbi:MAG: hypothetical protein AAGI25_15975 [Bacteroidota bacterium]